MSLKMVGSDKGLSTPSMGADMRTLGRRREEERRGEEERRRGEERRGEERKGRGEGVRTSVPGIPSGWDKIMPNTNSNKECVYFSVCANAPQVEGGEG